MTVTFDESKHHRSAVTGKFEDMPAQGLTGELLEEQAAPVPPVPPVPLDPLSNLALRDLDPPRLQFSFAMADGNEVVMPGATHHDAFYAWQRLEKRRAWHAGIGELPDFLHAYPSSPDDEGVTSYRYTDHEGTERLLATVEMVPANERRPLCARADLSCSECSAAADQPHDLDCIVTEDHTGRTDLGEQVAALHSLAADPDLTYRESLLAFDLDRYELLNGVQQERAAQALHGLLRGRQGYEREQVLDRSRSLTLADRAQRTVQVAAVARREASRRYEEAFRPGNEHLIGGATRALEAAGYAEAATARRLDLAQADARWVAGERDDPTATERNTDHRYRGQIFADPAANEPGADVIRHATHA